ncbi:hypothetical protein, partial [Conchiformibius kuhniae]|uniref:hypothetical protein n=1 Tax=Conchiformibius kuhniae TaxID=211502 RepID=UPI001B7FEFA3
MPFYGNARWRLLPADRALPRPFRRIGTKIAESKLLHQNCCIKIVASKLLHQNCCIKIVASKL